MNYLFILLNLIIVNVNSLNPLSVFKSNYQDTSIKVYKKVNSDNNNKNIVFYTGGNSIIPSEIYSNFIKVLALSNYNVYAVTNDENINNDLFDYLEESKSETIMLGHSTGCVNAIKESNNNKFIKKLILMDPVNNNNIFNFNPIPFIKEKKEELNLKYIKDILLLNAEKSYEWSVYPKFNMPFIPIFAMKKNDIKKLKSNLNLQVSKAKDYGHSDILDSMYSDFMHSTISKGNEDRSEEDMYKYYIWILEQINNFVDVNSLTSNITKND